MSEKTWIDRAREVKQSGIPELTCQSCSKRFPVPVLKPYGKEKKLTCPSCIKIDEDEKRRKRDERKAVVPSEPRTRSPAPVVDLSSIGDMIKAAVKEAVPVMDTAGLMSAINSIKLEMGSKGKSSINAPVDLSERSMFSFICNAKNVYLGEFVSIFGENLMHCVKVKLLVMWRDDLLWKNTNGRYMVNPEMTMSKMKGMGIEINEPAFLAYMNVMKQQAIDKKYKPFSMLGKMKKYVIDIIESG